MSADVMEERVGQLEGRVGRIETSVALLGSKQDSMAAQVNDIGAGVRKLLEQDARRPEPTNLKTIAATCAALLTVAYVGSWLVEKTPVIEAIKERLAKLDDEQTGRVTRLEKDAGWAAKVYVEK